MEYTIQQLAQLAGTTTRTLRHYHHIGLLAPAYINSSGYRIYGTTQVDMLQQILFYKELDFPLEEIKSILHNPRFDTITALGQHLIRLRQKQANIAALITNAQNTILHLKGESQMEDTEKFESFKKNKMAENEEKYGAEIRLCYGEDTIEKSNTKMLAMTQEEYQQFTALEAELNSTLAAAVAQGDPTSELAQKTAALHKEWLCFTWPTYSPQAHLQLAQGYTLDERFTSYYEKIAPGAAKFLYAALCIYLG